MRNRQKYLSLENQSKSLKLLFGSVALHQFSQGEFFLVFLVWNDTNM